ncbi:MAG: 16S rRNA (cytidine(1402)-2'-O)-methyltransferase, partial [Gammaproteobacteria bacterium]|nr:16S rRNA (cytidine(1402)-2'-O)-methyltransferase [Gammaproteobacteria bacterium]
TPIGNRSDMSQRAIDILSQVNLIAAEDTRHSRHLLDYFNIKTRMIAYHDHNEEQKTPVIVDKLLAGEDIALISDAGTPLMSDPGYRLVKAARDAGLQVSPVPGACAAIAALSVSGMPTDQFYFAGFSPARSGARKIFFESLRQQQATLVFYESSHRIAASLRDMVAVFGADRSAVVARELTKAFETVQMDRLEDLADWVDMDANQRKGEFVVLVEGVAARTDDIDAHAEHVLGVLMAELPLKQASQLASAITGIKKNKLYKLALEKNSN